MGFKDIVLVFYTHVHNVIHTSYIKVLFIAACCLVAIY